MYYILFFIFYLLGTNLLELFHPNRKIAINNIQFFHATTASILGLLNQVYIFKYNSMGYFLFDLYDLCKNKKLNFANSLYIYHHIVIIYYMSLDPNKFNWIGVLTVGELSNLPTYYVYDEIQTKKNYDKLNIVYDNKKLMKWKTMQLLVYGIMRIPVATYLTYNEVKDYDKFIYMIPILPLYFLGMVWWYYMIKLFNK